MKFAHLADCHIGSWRDPKLRDVPIKAFVKAMNLSIDKDVDFVLISGDLFNTSIPSIDSLKETVDKMKELKDKNIPIYLIAGSHDFSPSNKTMLDVLEKAGLFVNVAKGEEVEDKLKLNFTVDKKTGAKIVGLPGKKGGLEKGYYSSLLKENLEKEEGYKIFMFHSALTEFKPEDLKEMDSHPLSMLPRDFDYYAGGHVHYRFNKKEEGFGLIAYPGPLFPNNFKELEDLERGGLYFVDVEDGETSITSEPIQVYNLFKLRIDANNKTPAQVEADIKKEIEGKEFNNTIVTLRIEGTLLSGKPTDIDFKAISEILYDKSAYFVMKNISKLITKEFEEVKVESGDVEDIESKLIKEHLGQINVSKFDVDKEERLIKNLMSALADEKKDGETVSDFENRIKSEAKSILNL